MLPLSGTWQFGVMEGPGQLVHPRHRYYGSWSRNLPRGNGCFTFELNCMQHGYYTWIRDPQFDAAIYEQLKQEEQQPSQQSNDAVRLNIFSLLSIRFGLSIVFQ